jgi:ABC-type polysaccharide/polyol phosphate transport system ATPase subunit
MTDILIEAKHVSLSVPVYQPRDRRLLVNPLQFITDLYFRRSNRGIVTLLEDISLSIVPGERLGVIGRNGSGKSTLLRLLANIYRPSSGLLKVNGTVKGLFDISLGMNPEATGLENIYIRGLQMGLTLKQIREMLPSILEFSELEDHIGKPMNTYSTGMRLRLAVSISTMIAPDVLLLDEWIGTGDAHFRERIKARMNRLVQHSRGLVLATHNVSLMQSLCTKGLVLDRGRIVFLGPLDEALDFYNKDVPTS